MAAAGRNEAASVRHREIGEMWAEGLQYHVSEYQARPQGGPRLLCLWPSPGTVGLFLACVCDS